MQKARNHREAMEMQSFRKPKESAPTARSEFYTGAEPNNKSFLSPELPKLPQLPALPRQRALLQPSKPRSPKNQNQAGFLPGKLLPEANCFYHLQNKIRPF